MKKKTIQNVLLGLCVVLFLANCGGDSAGGDEGPTLSVSPTSVELKATGSEQVTISVNSNTSWTVSGVADWIKLGSNSGSKNGSFNIWAEDNNTGKDRSTTITIQVSRGSLSKTITVKQLAGASADKIEVSPNSLSFESGSGSKPFTVTTNVSSWTAKSNDESWCTISTNGNTVTVNVTDNPTTSARSTIITVSGGAATPQTVSVSQVGKEEKATIFEEPCMEWGGSVATVKSYMKALGYTALYDGELQQANDGSWQLSYQPKYKEAETRYDFTTQTSGLQYALVFFYLSQVSKGDLLQAFNEKGYTYSHTSDSYEYYLTKDGKTYVVYYLNQTGDYWVVYYCSAEEESYELAVNPASLSFAAAGETKNITVTSNDSWTVSSNQSWCTVSPSSGSNNGTIKVTAAANSSTSSRSATITIKGTNSGITKTVSVTQEGTSGGGVNIGRDEYGDDNNLNNK